MSMRIPLQQIGIGEAFAEYLNQNLEAICPALSFPELDRNDKITVENITVEVVDIRHDGEVELHYSYEWSFFSGCKDITDSGQVERSITGRIVGGSIEFQELLRTEARSTLEEY